METEKHIVRFWRGTRASYNIIKTAKMLDYWTRYTVQEPSGIWTEYYGENQISNESGQLLPVNSIVKVLPEASNLKPGDRYLVGSDGTGYNLVEVGVLIEGTEGQTTNRVIPLKPGIGVRVKDKGYMSYHLLDDPKVLVTYDEVDCGTY